MYPPYYSKYYSYRKQVEHVLAQANVQRLIKLPESKCEAECWVLSCHVIMSRLRDEGFDLSWPVKPFPDDDMYALRKLCQEFEHRNGVEMHALVCRAERYLGEKVTEKMLTDNAEGLFRNGVNMGKIVSLYTYCSMLACRYYYESMDLVQIVMIIKWLGQFTCKHLLPHIDTFALTCPFSKYYESKKQMEKPAWPGVFAMWTVFCLAPLLITVIIFAKSSK